MKRLPFSTQMVFGPVSLRHVGSPGRLVIEGYRGRRRIARLELEPGVGHLSLVLRTVKRLPLSTRTVFGPVSLRHLASPRRLVMEAYRGRRRLARLELEPNRGHLSLLLGGKQVSRHFWSMKRGLPVEPMHEAITSFDVVNAFSAAARMGADVAGEVEAALLSFIRVRINELLATMDGAGLRRARRVSEWERVEVYAQQTRGSRRH